LKALNIHHLRVNLNLSEVDYSDLLESATREAKALGASLEVALFATNATEGQLKLLIDEIDRLNPPVSTWLIFDLAGNSTTDEWFQSTKRHLLECDPNSKVGGGSYTNFGDLNRARSHIGMFDVVAYPLSPQVHAPYSSTIIENLEALSWMVKSARQFIGNTALIVTPITLKPQLYLSDEPKSNELPPTVDTRQISLIGAGWTLGSLKSLSESGVQSVTYYETVGWRGIMETERGSPMPQKFPSIPGAVFPLYHVLADVGEFAKGVVIPTTSTAPLRVNCMAVHKAGMMRVLIANLKRNHQKVRVTYGGSVRHARLKRLDETNAEYAIRSPETFRAEPGILLRNIDNPIELPAYGLCRIDFNSDLFNT
jgi:hypothetical protein